MYKIMERYSKKLMAVFAGVLMIAFFIPQFSRSNRTPSDIIAGEIGDEKISEQTIKDVHDQWQVLKERVFIEQTDPRTGEQRPAPLATVFGENSVAEIERHPAMFLLLQREAQRNGVTVSQRNLDGLLGEIQVKLEDRSVLYENVKDLEIGESVRDAVRAFLLVNNGYGQALGMIKVSQPMLNNRIAKELQEIKLQLVEFPGKDYADKIPVPTTQQIQVQFDKFADNLAGNADAKTNPFGFGYKYPDRVKIAYISVSRDEVKKSLRAAKSEYDWDVEAQRYYKHNGSLFPSTAPATSQPSDAFSLGALKSATTQPTTKPFAEVRDSIVEALIAPEAQKLEQAIQSKITSQMREDWSAYRDAMAKTPATAPSNPTGVAYDSPDYLPRLADQIQQEFKIVPTVAQLSEKFLTKTELNDLPGIGKAEVAVGQQFLPFNTYAIDLAAPFTKLLPEQINAAIKVWEPSRPLEDLSGTIYVFRITAADPSHKPGDWKDVLQQVEQDIRTAGAYDMAKADAEKVLEAARKSTLPTAAASAGKKTILTDSIQSMGPLPVKLPVSTVSQKDFVEQAFNLLGDAATGKSTTDMIGLPRDQKLFVVELADVQRIPLPPDEVIEPQVAYQITSELGRDLAPQWFSYDSLVKRMNYVDLNKKKDSEG